MADAWTNTPNFHTTLTTAETINILGGLLTAAALAASEGIGYQGDPENLAILADRIAGDFLRSRMEAAKDAGVMEQVELLTDIKDVSNVMSRGLGFYEERGGKGDFPPSGPDFEDLFGAFPGGVVDAFTTFGDFTADEVDETPV
jgi:hypothetical protein